ncbi:hypothetical protein SO802_008252 [Lithocarpus litseifolius]|uniref:Uncharacterized protein n=1 Tax=Lithocarpus litseifolius TaxID=425828 RepID=A0AAW2D834_9ROSI
MRRSEVDNKRFDKYQLEKEQGGSLEVGLEESKKGRDALAPLKRLTFGLYGKQVMDLNITYNEILERMLKQCEEGGKSDENKDLMDVLLKVYQDDKAEVKITRNHIKALLLVS